MPDSTKKEVVKLGGAIRDSISVLKEQFFQHKEVKGIQRSSKNLNSYFWRATGYIEGNIGAPNATAQLAMKNAEEETNKLLEKVKTLFDINWKEYRAKAEAVQYSLFKD